MTDVGNESQNRKCQNSKSCGQKKNTHKWRRKKTYGNRKEAGLNRKETADTIKFEISL